MYVTRISDFAGFLGMRELSIEEVLGHLVRKTFMDLGVTSLFVSSLNSSNQLRVMGHHGVDKRILETYPEGISIFDDFPISRCLRQGQPMVINTLPDWGADFPQLTHNHFPRNEKSFLCTPIEKCGTPVAVLGIYSLEKIEIDDKLSAFLKAVSNLLSLYLFRHSDVVQGSSRNGSNIVNEFDADDGQELTDRQLTILRMISERLTNLNISNILGYSESTIKQESIKIYSKLGCNGREEAAQIYKERYARADSSVS